jgi:uncharacterized protein
MLAASLYSHDAKDALQAALNCAFGPSAEFKGLYAKAIVSTKGTFARFDWPDWPSEATEELGKRVDEFNTTYHLQLVEQGSPEWNAIFRGSRGDPEAAEEIAKIFQKHLGGRLKWVLCLRDCRGRIGAQLGIEGVSQFGLDLSWNNTSAFVIGGHEVEDAMRAALNEVSDWAGRRIRPALRGLHDKLKALYGDRFRGLYVFGSYARPDAGIELPEDSDLDVALILSDFENPYDEITRFSEITSDLSLEYGLLVSLVPLREADYKQGRTNFIRVISEYAIPVK